MEPKPAETVAGTAYRAQKETDFETSLDTASQNPVETICDNSEERVPNDLTNQAGATNPATIDAGAKASVNEPAPSNTNEEDGRGIIFMESLVDAEFPTHMLSLN